MPVQISVIGAVAAALLTAAIVAFITTPVVRTLAFRVGAVDIPRDSRRMHNHPIPRMGGLAIFFGFILSALIFVPLDAPLRGMLLGAVVIVILGIFDDIYALPALPKLLVQIAAASVAVLMGSRCCPTPISSAATPTGIWASCPSPSRCSGSWASPTRST